MDNSTNLVFTLPSQPAFASTVTVFPPPRPKLWVNTGRRDRAGSAVRVVDATP
jgi:hypothetical protein